MRTLLTSFPARIYSTRCSNPRLLSLALLCRVFEAIPAAILQSHAFLDSDMSSLLPLLSLATSILSIAYSSAMVSLDCDCNPRKRRVAPPFYGYVPESASRRFIVFMAMVLFSAVHITLKVLGVARASLNPPIVGAMLGGDLLIYLVWYGTVWPESKAWLLT